VVFIRRVQVHGPELGSLWQLLNRQFSGVLSPFYPLQKLQDDCSNEPI